MKKIMFISSMGGHLSELLQLEPIYLKYDAYFVSEKTKTTTFLQDKFPGRVSYLKYATKKNLLLYAIVFPMNCIHSLYIFMKVKPDVIISTGAHTSVPMCYIAHFMKKKVIYIETFANIHTKTMAGKLVYPIADHFIVQWDSMLKLYPNAICGGWIF